MQGGTSRANGRSSTQAHHWEELLQSYESPTCRLTGSGSLRCMLATRESGKMLAARVARHSGSPVSSRPTSLPHADVQHATLSGHA